MSVRQWKDSWQEYFEELINVEGKGEALILCMGMEKGGGRLYMQGPTSRREVKWAIGRLKLGKTPGIYILTAEIWR